MSAWLKDPLPPHTQLDLLCVSLSLFSSPFIFFLLHIPTILPPLLPTSLKTPLPPPPLSSTFSFCFRSGSVGRALSGVHKLHEEGPGLAPDELAPWVTSDGSVDMIRMLWD